MRHTQPRPRGIGMLLTCVLLACAGCALPGLLRQNTAIVQASTQGIAENTRMVARSAAVTERLLPAMEGLRALEQPMNSVAGLSPVLASVAALDAPMSSVATLDGPMRELSTLSPDMRAVARLAGPMNRVAMMRPSLDAVSALRTPMEHVAALQPELRAVAELQGSMRELAALREPLVLVAELRQPMTRLAALAPVSHPLGLVALAVLGLALWGAVTFFAVRLAVASALRHSRPR